jgi:hypothetical protein
LHSLGVYEVDNCYTYKRRSRAGKKVIQDRIRYFKKQLERTGDREEASNTGPDHLIPLVGGEHEDKASGLNISLLDYLELTDWAGRDIREDKSGSIPSNLAPILNIEPETWIESVKSYSQNYNTIIGKRKR